MLRNYLKVAFRTLRRQKGFAFINVFGLAVGIAVCLLIARYVQHEWSYDRFHAQSDRLARAFVDEQYEDQRFLNTITPIPLGPRLETTFPEVEESVRLYAFSDVMRRDERQFSERMHLADAAFFDVFGFPLLRGNPETALSEPGRVVLTERTAQKYFGDADPMGQTLTARIGGQMQELTVTGVAEDPPAASSIQFGALVPWAMNGFREASKTAWFQVYPETYVLLREGADLAALEAKLPTLVEQVIPADDQDNYTIGLQPITDIHLNTALPAGLEPTSSPAYAYILTGIALFILLIACINFVTLTLGRSADRAREVGVRKAVGARRGQLARQFWGEALLLTAAALALGLALARTALPFFNALAGQTLALPAGWPLALFVLAVVAVVGLAAGSYPALVLSGFRPAEVLRGRLSLKGDRSLLRRGLVVVQFTLAIFLIASTLVMVRQMHFLQTKNLGFDKEQVVVVPTAGTFSEGFRTTELLRGELMGQPGIVDVTASAFQFGGPGWAEIGYRADDGTYREFNANFAGYDFAETYGLTVTAGRSFSRAVSADTSLGIVVNETLVEAYGWEDPIGKKLPGPFPDHEIIGVVEDFHYASLHTPVEPLVIARNPDLVLRGAANVMIPGETNPKVAVRIRGADVPATLERIEATWNEVAPTQPFAFAFADDAVDRQYRAERRLSRLVSIGAGLAIFIACLGLFGLAALAAVRRTKEIGVRKVLGASTPSVMRLLSKDFLKLVGLAFVVATPVAYLAMRVWLTDFAYRIDLGVGVFLAAGLGAVLVALLATSYHAFRAATADPVESLRYE